MRSVTVLERYLFIKLGPDYYMFATHMVDSTTHLKFNTTSKKYYIVNCALNVFCYCYAVEASDCHNTEALKPHNLP